MRYIAVIAVVAIIAVAVIIGLLIQRLKNRQTEELNAVRQQLKLAQDQLGIAMPTLRTIRDLQGDSAIDAMAALESIESFRDKYYNQEGITR